MTGWRLLLSASVNEPAILDKAAALRVLNGPPVNGAFLRVKVVYLAKDEKGQIKIDPETKEPVRMTLDANDLIESVNVEIASYLVEES